MRGEFLNVKHKTIFHDILDNQALPQSDKTVDRLWQEAQLLLAAGTVTTATAISSAFVYLLLDHERLAVLLEELEFAMPDINTPITAADLEQLPYLVSDSLKLLEYPLTVEPESSRSRNTAARFGCFLPSYTVRANRDSSRRQMDNPAQRKLCFIRLLR